MQRQKREKREGRRNRPFIRDVAHSQEKDMRHEGTLGMAALLAMEVLIANRPSCLPASLSAGISDVYHMRGLCMPGLCMPGLCMLGLCMPGLCSAGEED